MNNVIMPNVQAMDSLLSNKLKSGTIGLRLFVQMNSDLTEDDFASDYLQMEKARAFTPKETLHNI